ncbi:MAG: response regulator [Granulosicoccus sp.]
MNLAVQRPPDASSQLDVVVVDDDQLTLEIVAWIFRDTQSRHQLFSDPDAAMVHLRERLPRILIVDYYMPMQNGIDFLSQLHATVDMRNCSVYLCSAVTPQKNQLDQIKALGARIMDKTLMCSRASLLDLVESPQHVTGNE